MVTCALTFLYGGLLGVFAAAILEPIIIHRMSFSTPFFIGLIEEFAKVLGVLLIARHHRHGSEMDGIILGAASGMGFAALESLGYGFTAFLRSGGSLSATVTVTLLRGLLSPLGHGTWTAILVSVIFHESDGQHYHFNLKVLAAYLTVVVLHGLWDGLPMVISTLVGQGIDVLIGQLFVGAVGLLILFWRWREAQRLETA